MSKKIQLTRPELKKRRDMLARFQRYLPMLKLKQQQLQMKVRELLKTRRAAKQALSEAQATFDAYQEILTDTAGLDIRGLAACEKINTSKANIAGVNVPIFESVEFPDVTYSLFSTPPWADQALADLRRISRHQAELDVLTEQYRLLQSELTKIIQRVNLFEKVKIPECQEAIRVIRIKLGDEMTAAVGRAKIAKTKLSASEATVYETDHKKAEATSE